MVRAMRYGSLEHRLLLIPVADITLNKDAALFILVKLVLNLLPAFQVEVSKGDKSPAGHEFADACLPDACIRPSSAIAGWGDIKLLTIGSSCKDDRLAFELGPINVEVVLERTSVAVLLHVLLKETNDQTTILTE